MDDLTWQLLKACTPAAIAATIYAGFAIGTYRRRRPIADPTVYGDAHFATASEIRKTPLLGGRGHYLGAVRSRDGTLHYLRYPGPGNIGVYGPSRSGKGLGNILTALLTIPHSVVVNDVKGELWEQSAGWRSREAGNRVLRFSPAAARGSCIWNPFNDIRIGSPHEFGDAANQALLICDPDGKGLDLSTFWVKAAYMTMIGAILHVLARDPLAGPPDVATLLSDPTRNTKALWEEMKRSPHNEIAMTGADMLAKGEDRERPGVESEFKTHLIVFRDPLVARHTRGKSDFRLEDVMDGPEPLSLYVVNPGDDGPRMRGLTRLLLASFLRSATSVPLQFAAGTPRPPHLHRCTLIIDEMPELKRMQPIEEKLPVMLGYGIDGIFAMQDRGALIREYTIHQSITRNFAVKVVYPPHEHIEAEWIAKELGQRTVVLPNVMESGRRAGALSNVSRSLQHVAAPLMTPDQVKNLRRPTKDATGRITEPGDVVILFEGLAIRCEQIIAPHDPEFARRMAIPPP